MVEGKKGNRSTYQGAVMTVTITEAQVTRYVVRTGYDYGVFFIDWGKESVTVSTTGSYGEYGYHWNATGPDPRAFLQHVSFEYVAGKFKGNNAYVFDKQTQETAMKRELLAMRRSEAIDKEEAREVWDEVEAIMTESNTSNEFIRELYERDHAFDVLYDSDHGAVQAAEMPDPQLVGFWRDVWKPLMAHLKSTTEVNP